MKSEVGMRKSEVGMRPSTSSGETKSEKKIADTAFSAFRIHTSEFQYLSSE